MPFKMTSNSNHRTKKKTKKQSYRNTKNQKSTEKQIPSFASNANSPALGGCHPNSNIITRLSEQLPFHPHFYLKSRQQNITIITS